MSSNKVNMDDVINYILYTADKYKIAVNSPLLEGVLYITCVSLIKQDRLYNDASFNNFYIPGKFIKSKYILENLLQGSENIQALVNNHSVPELDDMELYIASQLNSGAIFLQNYLVNNSYLYNKVMHRKEMNKGTDDVFITFDDLKKESFSPSNKHSYHYKANLTVSFDSSLDLNCTDREKVMDEVRCHLNDATLNLSVIEGKKIWKICTRLLL